MITTSRRSFGLPLAVIGLLMGASGCSAESNATGFTLDDMQALNLGLRGGTWQAWDVEPERAKDIYDHISGGTYFETLDPQACREWVFAGGFVTPQDAHNGDLIDTLGAVSFEPSTDDEEPLWFAVSVRVLGTEPDAIAFLRAVEDAALACEGGYTYTQTITTDGVETDVLSGTEDLDVETSVIADGSESIVVVSKGVSHVGFERIERVERRILQFWQHGNVVVELSTGDVVDDSVVIATATERESLLTQIGEQLDKILLTRSQEES